MTDTPPEIAELVRLRLMALSGAERFRMGSQMFDAARRMVLASLPAGLTETERNRRLFERIYGEKLPFFFDGDRFTAVTPPGKIAPCQVQPSPEASPNSLWP